MRLQLPFVWSADRPVLQLRSSTLRSMSNFLWRKQLLAFFQMLVLLPCKNCVHFHFTTYTQPYLSLKQLGKTWILHVQLPCFPVSCCELKKGAHERYLHNGFVSMALCVSHHLWDLVTQAWHIFVPMSPCHTATNQVISRNVFFFLMFFISLLEMKMKTKCHRSVILNTTYT